LYIGSVFYRTAKFTYYLYFFVNSIEFSTQRFILTANDCFTYSFQDVSFKFLPHCTSSVALKEGAESRSFSLIFEKHGLSLFSLMLAEFVDILYQARKEKFLLFLL